jgi:carboxymethylenebutenolidase
MYKEGLPETNQEQIESLVHLHIDGAINRRDLLARLAKYTGGAAGAAAVVQSMGLAQAVDTCPADVRVPEDAPDVEWHDIQYPGKAGTLYALLAHPRPLTSALPAVMVIHENRGLNEHIRDVTRRVARAGFVALGIDLLSRQGGSWNFLDPVLGVQAYGRTQAGERLEDMLSSIEYLNSEGFVLSGKIGAVGFCAGGGNVYSLAFASKELKAGVAFYGTPPSPLPSFDNLTAQLLCIFSETDRNQAARIPDLVAGLVANRKSFGLHLYQGTGHGFHNDTGAAYNRAAACDAWSKTIAFFNQHLRS